MTKNFRDKTRGIADYSQALWCWWSTELGEALPTPVKTWFGGQPVETITLDPKLTFSSSNWNRGGRRVARLHLIASPDAILMIQRDLPFAAIGSLDAIFRTDIDRLTPYTANDVAFGRRIVGYDWSRQMLRVAVAVIRRDEMDRLKEQLAHAGVAAKEAVLWIEVHRIGIPLAPAASRAPVIRHRIAGGARGLGLAALIGLTFALPSLKMGAVAAHWERESRRLETLITPSTPAAIAVERHRLRIERLNDRLPGQVAAFDLLSEFSRVLPAGTWLNSLKLSRDEIRIIGLSPDTSKVLSRLGASEMIRDVTQKAPIERDAQTGLSRFDLVARPAAPKSP